MCPRAASFSAPFWTTEPPGQFQTPQPSVVQAQGDTMPTISLKSESAWGFVSHHPDVVILIDKRCRGNRDTCRSLKTESETA